jgi:hypothetical protein
LRWLAVAGFTNEKEWNEPESVGREEAQKKGEFGGNG